MGLAVSRAPKDTLRVGRYIKDYKRCLKMSREEVDELTPEELKEIKYVNGF